MIAGLVDRRYEEGYNAGDTIRIQRFPNFEVETKSASTALNAINYTDTEQTISINVHQGVATKVESIVKALSNIDIMERTAGKMGYGLARALDVNLAALVASFSQTVGTLGVELTFDNLLRAEQYLRDNGFRMEDAALLLCPAQSIALHKLDNFTADTYVGDANALRAFERGEIKKFHKARIVESNLVTANGAGHDNALFCKEGIALVMVTNKKKWTESIALDLAEVMAMEQLYGRAEINKYSEAAGNITATDEQQIWLKGL